MKNIIELNKYVINLSSGLLFTFFGAILFTGAKNDTEFYLIILTIFNLFLTIVTYIWYNYRFAIRKSIFDKKIKEFADTSFRSALEQAEKVGEYNVNEQAQTFFKEYPNLIKDKSKEEILFYLDLYFDKHEGKVDKKKENFREVIVQGLMSQINIIRKESFLCPLEEKLSSLKWLCDRVAFLLKIYVFVISILLFLITTIILLGG